MKTATTISSQQQQSNERIYSRNIPSQNLQPYFDPRPRNSKYTFLPIVEPHILEHSVPLQCFGTYSPAKTFNPGNRNAPFNGYQAAVNVESELKGQIFALQKCSQATYVPKSSSDLYQNSFLTQSSWAAAIPDHHELLFQKSGPFREFNPNPAPTVVGVQWLGNPTRVQMQDVVNPCAPNIAK